MVQSASTHRHDLWDGRYVVPPSLVHRPSRKGGAELHLMSSSLASLSPADRTASTLELIDRLLENSNAVSKKMENAEQFGTFVVSR